LENIRTCLRCNEGCSSRVPKGMTQRCAVNAEVGRERIMRIHPVPRPKQICIIGGGPAGLEAARILALRKHRVTLIEKDSDLGGLLRYAALPDFKTELRGYLNYLKIQVQKCGVDLMLNCQATIEIVGDLKPAAVVLAAGSEMPLPEIPGADLPMVGTALSLLSGKHKTGECVLVAGGGAMGCEIAAYLAAQGKKVILVEMLSDLAIDLENRSRAALLQMLKKNGVEILTDRRVLGIETGYVLLTDGEQNKGEVAVDSVILALGLKPNRTLLQPLKENFKECYAIGDCLEPRRIYQAVHEGAFIGRAI
jgi:2-enoate reductase